MRWCGYEDRKHERHPHPGPRIKSGAGSLPEGEGAKDKDAGFPITNVGNDGREGEIQQEKAEIDNSKQEVPS